MCLALYLITSDQLSVSKWEEESPGVWIQEESTKDLGASSWVTRGQTAYYIGGYQGCGCGWGRAHEFDDESDVKSKAADRKALAGILSSLEDSASWLVACWEGEFGCELLPSVTLLVDDLLDLGFDLEEKRKYAIA